MASSPIPGDFVRREFHELHPKDQQIKQTKKLCIEKNWEFPVQECLPSEIRPRCEIKKGAKARIGDAEVMEEIWWNWSVELLKALEELSSMTVKDLDYARELLLIEVEQRQGNPKSSQRKIIELLLGDAQRVVDEQRKRAAAGYDQEEMAADEEGMVLGYGNPYAAMSGRAPTYGYDDHHMIGNGQDTMLQGMEEHTVDGAQGNAFNNFPPMPAATQYHSDDEMPHISMLNVKSQPRSHVRAPAMKSPRAEASFGVDRQGLTEHLKTTELKATALRLRSQAVSMEAEAVELEVKARELREQLEKMETA